MQLTLTRIMVLLSDMDPTIFPRGRGGLPVKLVNITVKSFFYKSLFYDYFLSLQIQEGGVAL